MSIDAKHIERWVAYAVLYSTKYGLSVMPIGEDKKPAIKWLELQSRRATVNELLSWPKYNLGVITGSISNLVVVDCESREDAEWFWNNRGKSPVIVQTRRGFHFYFKHPGQRIANGIKIENRYDVRGEGGFVMVPPSIHKEGCYTWKQPLIETDKLPAFNPEWRPDTKGLLKSDKEIHDAEAYIATIRAVSGQGGHNDTYRAAAVLREAGLSEAEALLAMQAWNKTNAEPPWSDRELLHKVRSAYADTCEMSV